MWWRDSRRVDGGCAGDEVVGSGQRIGRYGRRCVHRGGRSHRGRCSVRSGGLIAAGVTTEDAAAAVGVSTPVAARWFRHAGGMPPISLDEPTGRYLSFAEREEIALLKAQDHGVREIARRIGRDPSTISRELRRNAATRAGQRVYRAGVAQWKAQQAAKRPKPAKLATNPRLRAYVEHRLAGEVTDADGTTDRGPERAVGRTTARTSQGPALGCGLEPGTDQPPVEDRLPR